MNQRNELPRLTEQLLLQALALLGRAFHQDLLSVYVFPDKAESALYRRSGHSLWQQVSSGLPPSHGTLTSV